MRWYVSYTSSLGRERKFCWSAFVTRLLTPRSRKSGYGLLLGCRSGFDRGPFEKLFLDEVRTQKPGKYSLSVLAHGRNRSGVVESVGREPLIIARVENGVTKFSPQSDRKRQNFQKNWIRKTVFSGEFQFTNFHFFGRGKTNFFWATMITMSIDIVSLSLLSLDRLLPSESVNMFLSSSP